jgi:poly(beta-D-mannuronate) lyase
MNTSAFKTVAAAVSLIGLSFGGIVSAQTGQPSASNFDLSQWKITLPMDDDGDDKPDEIDVKEIAKYSHPDYFYLDDDGRMVFTAPNKAITTANSSNTRSELRQMLRGTNTKIKTHDAANNFAVKARKDSDKFGSVGGKMEATLRVDHVAKNAGNPASKPAYSVVVGQIHADKYKSTKSGFGYGNEPIKIFYKKLPGHETGSVFWTYERNLAKDNPERRDIAYPVFGNLWDNPADPGEAGIALGEDFSYTINVHRNVMYVTFSNARHGEVTFVKTLVGQRDANGEVDEKDNRYSYGGDTLYFKAGVYNQCSTKTDGSFWAAACSGTGDWPTDEANGDYTRASFSKLVVRPSNAPDEGSFLAGWACHKAD